MKKMILTVGAAMLLCGQSMAQGAYVNVGGGFGFSAGSSSVFGSDLVSNTTSTTTSSTDESLSGSLGKGIKIGAGFGYMFNDYVGAELGVGYHIGGKTEWKSTSTNSTTNYSFSGSMIQLSPSLVVAGGTEGMVPYARFGLVMGLGTKALKDKSETGSSTETKKTEYSGGMAFGFNGAAGVKFELNDKMFLFAEAGLVSLSWAPTKSVITEWKEDAVDKLAGKDKSDIEKEYVDSYTTDFSATPNTSSPSKSIKWYYPFSSFGINIGLNINF